MSAPKTLGIHHAGLTVPDLAAARRFFVDALGFQQIGEQPKYPAVFVSDGTAMLTLWQAAKGARTADRKNAVGLHHLALRVASPAVLEELHETLGQREDVEIEFAPEPLGESPHRHMMCFITGNIRLELIAAG